MSNINSIGTGPSVVKRFLLIENSGFTIPPNASLLYSEVVTNDEGQEILEVWLAVPTSVDQFGRPASGRTIYNKTTVYEEDDDFDLPEPVDEDDFRRQIEDSVNSNFEDDEDDY